MSRSRAIPHPIADLPFVADRTPDEKNERRRCFWSVKPSGDYQHDDMLGEELAFAYLRHEAALDHNLEPYILPHIVCDMPRELTPIETSFLTMVAIAASAGVPKAERVAAYWEQCRAEREAEERAKEERRAARRKRPARAKAPNTAAT